MLQLECGGMEGPVSKSQGMQMGNVGEIWFNIISRVPQAWSKGHTTSQLQGCCGLYAEGFTLSGSHWDPTEPRQPRYMDGTHSGNSVCHQHRPGWGQQGYIHGHGDPHSGENGSWEPPHCSQSPRVHHRGHQLPPLWKQRQMATLKQSNYGGSCQCWLRLCKFIVSVSFRNYYSSCGFT